MWRLQLLGELRLARNGETLSKLRSPKYGHLLAYLATYTRRSHTREELVEIFWPDEDIENGKACLRTALSTLRTSLACPDLFISTNRHLVRLNDAVLTTDVAEFESLVRRKDAKARDVYVGPFLPSCYDDWADNERIRLDHLADGIDASFTSSRAMANFPAPLTKFFGREELLVQIRDLVSLGQPRLVTLLGIGGAGKTRLAIEAIGHVDQLTAFVNCAQQTDCTELDLALCQALGIETSASTDVAKELKHALNADRITIVVDNFEHLVEHGGREWMGRLLDISRSLQIVATSRIPIGLPGEVRIGVASLEKESAKAMFLDRARLAQPDFAETADLDALCASLDHLPLALEMCAGWSDVLSLKAMHSELKDRFSLMTSRTEPGVDRHSSMEKILQWCCPVESELFRVLCSISVLVGSWTIDAAAAVVGRQAYAEIAKLRDRSLVVSSIEGQELRLTLLEVARDFAMRFGSDAVEAARRAHHDHFMSRAFYLAEAHQTDYLGALIALDRDWPNIRAAFEYGAAADSETLNLTLRAFERIRWCLWVRGHGEELQNLTRQFIARLPDHPIPLGRALLNLFACRYYSETEQSEKAISHCQEAIHLFRELGEGWYLVTSIQNLALLYEQRGDYALAAECYLSALPEIHPDDHQARYVAMAYVAGMYLDRLNDVSRARPLYEQGVEFWKTQSNGEGHLAMMYRSLAKCEYLSGNFAAAHTLLNDALEIFKRTGETMRVEQTARYVNECRELELSSSSCPDPGSTSCP